VRAIDDDHVALVTSVCEAAAGTAGDVSEVVTAAVDRLAPLIPDADRSRTIAAAVARLAGLDALEVHLADPAVDEVMVNAGRQIWVDRAGRLAPAGTLPPAAVEVVLERVLAPVGKRLDRLDPIVDVRLPDGSRLCAVIAPVAVDGTTVSIRRHRQRPFTIADFTDDPNAQRLLQTLVDRRCNLLVSGATSSGKTSLLAALLGTVGATERLVVCEDTTELQLPGAHVVRLEARRANADGVPAIDLATLVRTALRMRPDRLIVGEFRGCEALAAIEAMNTGHDGSLATCHANSAVDALRRVETLVMQATPSWPLAAIRRQLTRSIDAVIHLGRDPSGQRCLVDVVEVVEADTEPSVRSLLTGATELRRERRSA
jgi:pilus assembly protein CpaF